jgi:hypothetical protein
LRTYDKLKEKILDKYPNYANVWVEAEAAGGEAWIQEFDFHVTAVFGSNTASILEAVDGYAEFCTDALRAQVFFEKNGRYKATNYSQVLEDCYHSADYMLRKYLPGQFISHYVWPHHKKMLSGFLTDLLPRAGDIKTFYEVGVGCGMYSLKTLEACSDANGVAFDISEHSLAFTRRVINAHGYEKRFSICLQDIVAKPVQQPCDLIISQEVLEHLEDPESFIRALRRMVKPGGYGYITAAINAGHTDHIYLYRSPEEVEAQLTDAGFKILGRQIESNYQEKPVHLRPTAAGYLVLNEQ